MYLIELLGVLCLSQCIILLQMAENDNAYSFVPLMTCNVTGLKKFPYRNEGLSSLLS